MTGETEGPAQSQLTNATIGVMQSSNPAIQWKHPEHRGILETWELKTIHFQGAPSSVEDRNHSFLRKVLYKLNTTEVNHAIPRTHHIWRRDSSQSSSKPRRGSTEKI